MSDWTRSSTRISRLKLPRRQVWQHTLAAWASHAGAILSLSQQFVTIYVFNNPFYIGLPSSCSIYCTCCCLQKRLAKEAKE